MTQSGEFPNLTNSTFWPTSDEHPYYNCIAWAAERGPDEQEWWWPEGDGATWPPNVHRKLSLSSFIQAFGTLGYELCLDGVREAGWQKVVIYLSSDGTPTHMARQLSDGQWTSKLGQDIDITHTTVDVLEGPMYGKASQYLRRRNPSF